MAHFGTGVEYALHCLLWLVDHDVVRPSSRELAELQGAPTSFVAKLFPKLEKAGIVSASSGRGGGYRLARPATEITALDVVYAVEGRRPLFECHQIRGRCAVASSNGEASALRGVCGIHALMLSAEAQMREVLAATTLDDLAQGARRKAGDTFVADVRSWFDGRARTRRLTDDGILQAPRGQPEEEHGEERGSR